MEIAFISANKIHIEIEKKQEGFLAKVLTRLTKKPSKFIATMLIGNNIALVIYGFFMGDLLMQWFQGMLQVSNHFLNLVLTDFSLLTQTVISTLIILFTAEFLPKVLFQIYSNTLLKFLALPSYLFYLIFSVISEFVIWVSDFVLKTFFKTDGDEVQLSFSKIELGDYITEQMGALQEEDEVDSEIQIFQNALEFAAVKAREVMVPRTEITAVNVTLSGKRIAIEKSNYVNLFEVSNEFASYEKDGYYFLEQGNSDGAGAYQVVWVFNSKGLQQLWVSEYE